MNNNKIRVTSKSHKSAGNLRVQSQIYRERGKQLPRLAKGSYVLEKLCLTNFKRKKLKRIKPYAFKKCKH
ncbi:hypothetical protein H5410_050918, partial [Solanum commersonii]